MYCNVFSANNEWTLSMLIKKFLRNIADEEMSKINVSKNMFENIRECRKWELGETKTVVDQYLFRFIFIFINLNEILARKWDISNLCWANELVVPILKRDIDYGEVKCCYCFLIYLLLKAPFLRRCELWFSRGMQRENINRRHFLIYFANNYEQ